MDTETQAVETEAPDPILAAQEAAMRWRRKNPGSASDNPGASGETERESHCLRCTTRRADIEHRIARIGNPTGNVFIGRSDSPIEREKAVLALQSQLRDLPEDGRVQQKFVGPPLSIWGPLNCQRCDAELRAEVERQDKARDEADSLFAEQARERRMVASGLPLEYAKGVRGVASLDEADAPKTRGFQVAREECARVILGTSELPWVWLWERTGGGYKTTLMALAIRNAIKLGLDAAYVSWGDFVISLRDFDGEPETKRYKKLRDVAILGVDDLGVEKPSRASGEALYNVVDARYHLDSCRDDGARGIIFTSNCSIAEYVARFAGIADDSRMATRLERRLMEMATEIAIFEIGDGGRRL